MQAFSERMFDIFSNEHLSSATMQALAMDVLFSMKDFPFKLPPEAVYVLRASSLVEGLGTSFMENFNGVKDILPVLMKNLPRAMGADANLISICINEATSLPLTLHKLKTIITNLSSEDLHIKISRETLELVAESLKGYLRGIALGMILILVSFYLLNFTFPFNKIFSLIFFALGAIRIFSAFR
jgi:predicted unusual protein kinase regulating ubiquinone biosynthesis (AarF/ABC1/UbiB family)